MIGSSATPTGCAISTSATWHVHRLGAIEGGIKAIAVQRAKQSGMHWTVEGAADIIALRCQYASGRWDELWPASHTRQAGLQAAI